MPDIPSLERQLSGDTAGKSDGSDADSPAAAFPSPSGRRPPSLRRHGSGKSTSFDKSTVLASARRYDPATSEVTGFLIDLDGTVYRPNSLIPGACAFHEFLVSTGKQFVYLSNTGAKSSEAVRRKLRTARYCLAAEKLPDASVWTAADAQVEFMAANIPEGAKIFVVSGGGDFWLDLLRARCPRLLDSWEVRTALSEEEAKQWATIAAVHPRDPLVWVVLFCDGPLSNCPDPKTGKDSPADWSYDLIRTCSYVLGHGAQLVYTADDSSNPAVDTAYEGYVWPQPGPGMFARMLVAIMQPRAASRVHCLGKGGNAGRRYMMQHAISMLMGQGHDGDPSKIMMIGDRFDTDIRAGRSVGVMTCLVETGAHTYDRQSDYPEDLAHYMSAGLGAMHALAHPRQMELPMVMRQPLRLWVLSTGNVVSSNAVAKGASLQLDACLREFYKREAASGAFGKRQLLKALDEIGLEVSEHQVDACLAGLLTHQGTITYPLFAQLIRQAMRSVGIDYSRRSSERAVDRLRAAVVRSADKRRASILLSRENGHPQGRLLWGRPAPTLGETRASGGGSCSAGKRLGGEGGGGGGSSMSGTATSSPGDSSMAAPPRPYPYTRRPSADGCLLRRTSSFASCNGSRSDESPDARPSPYRREASYGSKPLSSSSPSPEGGSGPSLSAFWRKRSSLPLVNTAPSVCNAGDPLGAGSAPCSPPAVACGPPGRSPSSAPGARPCQLRRGHSTSSSGLL